MKASTSGAKTGVVKTLKGIQAIRFQPTQVGKSGWVGSRQIANGWEIVPMVHPSNSYGCTGPHRGVVIYETIICWADRRSWGSFSPRVTQLKAKRTFSSTSDGIPAKRRIQRKCVQLTGVFIFLSFIDSLQQLGAITMSNMP